MVISVSRRCDIPRFAFDWFLEKLEAGFVEVKNPFNARQIRRVSLQPPQIFAFWTRDPTAILEYAEELEGRGYCFYVMTTITAYPEILEPGAPSLEAVIQSMKKLAQKITLDRLIWRYDPVFLSNITNFEFHRRNFASLAGRLNDAVKRVIVSVYDEYPRAEKRLAALEQTRPSGSLPFKRLPHYTEDKLLRPEVRDLLGELAEIAKNEGMEIQSCAEENLSEQGIKSGACIDGDYINSLFGPKTSGKTHLQKARFQRQRCLCAESVDIGSYGCCPAGCVYCYGLS